MNVVPCEFRKAIFQHAKGEGYWFRIYTIILFLNGEFETHCFLHQSDMLENACLLRELDIPCETRSFETLCTPKNEFKEVYKLIEDYVSVTGIDR